MTCNLGCTETCKARDHGCASECPALPWQPERGHVAQELAEANAEKPIQWPAKVPLALNLSDGLGPA